MMDVLVRGEMFLGDPDCSIPWHKKVQRLLQRLRGLSGLRWVNEFDALAWERWHQVHAAPYVNEVQVGDDGVYESANLPSSPEFRRTIPFAGASFVAAAMSALETGCAFSPTCGFHHAGRANAGPFCLLNALPLAACSALETDSVEQVLILDCDFHPGDGTDEILMHLDDSRIDHASLGFLFKSKDQAGMYMHRMDQVGNMISSGYFDLVLYQAGMDVLLGDPAGGGILSAAQARSRDEIVFRACCDSSTPIAWNLAGGYQSATDERDPTVDAHIATVEVAMEVFGFA